MTDPDCTAFLQWALPQMNLHWSGFRKVRRQVCKRLRKRLIELEIVSFQQYKARLQSDPTEWHALDECCHITISRFFRDRGVFELVRRFVLADIALRAKREGRAVQVWSAGCASGEEPYTLKILWDFEVAPEYPGVSISIIATDVDHDMLVRAREGCFKQSSLHELPQYLIDRAFDRQDGLYCVRAKHREGIAFVYQDMRSEMPPSSFDLVLCRYVAFTYFSESLQQVIAAGIANRLFPNGYLIIGTHEQLPTGTPMFAPFAGSAQVFRKQMDSRR